MDAALPTRVWYLEMRSPDALRPRAAPPGVAVAHAEVPLGALNRFLYEEVGRDHHWVDQLGRDDAQWQAHAEQVETWLAWEHGTPAGYGELWRVDRQTVDVGYFGLLPAFEGHGIGGHLLSEVTRRAWSLEPSRVTVNTCELDGEHALANYRARGFEVVREASEPRRRSAPAA